MIVTLSDGQAVNVKSVPPFALAVVAAKFPVPDGEKKEIAIALAEQERRQREVAWLIAFEGLAVPEEWQFPDGLRYVGIEPRAGEKGRLLDYIEFGLLQTSADVSKVQTVMYDSAVTEEEIEAAEAVFPDNG